MVDDPDRAPDTGDRSSEKTQDATAQTSASGPTEEEERAQRYLQPQNQDASTVGRSSASQPYVPSAVQPAQASSHQYVQTAPQTDQTGVPSGLTERQKQFEQQEHQLEEAAERQRRQILTQQLRPNYTLQ